MLAIGYKDKETGYKIMYSMIPLPPFKESTEREKTEGNTARIL